MRSSSPSIAATAAAPARPAWRDYLELTKPEITFLVALSALAGFAVGAPAMDPWLLAATLLGVSLCSAGAAALNHVKEAHLDAQMKRTAQRPLPSGRISMRAGRRYGFGLAALGIAILCPLVNPLTAALAALAGVLYLYVYTPLKRSTPHNTLVGTLPGALPALGGYTAATGVVAAEGWLLFAVLVFWQMPHFLSLSWMYRKDYARGGYAMLTVGDDDGTATVRQTVAYSVLLGAASLLPWALGTLGAVYGIGALVLGIYFARPVADFARTRSVQDARRVLKASVLYIPALVAMVVIDRLV